MIPAADALGLLGGSYLVLIAVAIAGVRRLPRSRRADDAACPPVSIVVTARNEERDLPACLASLAQLDYPAEKLELILVNDRSTDRTGALIDAFCAANAHAHAVHTEREPPVPLEAKARGLAHGFARATGEWVLVVDADARVHPAWARHLLGRVDASTGLVGGAVVVDAVSAVGVVERVAWTYCQLFSLGAAGWSQPFIALGPNMGIRRAAYVAAGGLEAAQFRIAEDLALTRIALGAGLRCQLYADPETTAVMAPVSSFGAVISQQRRWYFGGSEAPGVVRVGLGAAFAWGAAVAAFATFGWAVSLWPWLLFTTLRAVVDGVAFGLLRARLQLDRQLRYLPLVELYAPFAFLFLPLSLLVDRRVTWRGAGYAVRYGVARARDE